MFISFCRVVLDKIDPSALNLVCYALFIVDVVENPRYMIVNYLSEFSGIQFEVSYSPSVLRRKIDHYDHVSCYVPTTLSFRSARTAGVFNE